ncbi:MAG: glycosyltransferase family 4 protein, partial [Verrucomicrobia bacterium]|nr:glycosyltransferase family 4 protein [Verrucomicrobiota bacterium]
QRADVIIASQDNENAYYRSICQRRVLTVGHVVTCAEVVKPVTDPTILYLASENPANADALTYLVTDILPLVKASCPSCRLLVAGGICDGLPDHADYEKLGRVDSVVDAYARARVVVNPILSGTGIKIKAIEAMGYGKPVVATPKGILGMEDAAGTGAIVAQTTEAFAGHVAALLTDDALAQKTSEQALAYARAYNVRCMTRLREALDARGHRAGAHHEREKTCA